MLSFLNKTKPVASTEPNAFTVLDIGTDLVKVLVCRVENGRGRVLGVGRQKQRLGDMHSGSIIDIESVTENCREALREAETMAQTAPTDIIVGIAGELVRGLTSSIEYTRADYFSEISMAELQNIVHKIQWKAFDEIRKELKQETGHEQVDIKLVHSAITQVEIDGYKISNPLGFKGRNVRLSVFNVFAPLIHFESIGTIAQLLNKELLSIASEPYAVSKALGFEDGSDFSAIFIDIGGGTTDVAVVVNGGVVGTKMYGVGGRVFTKRLAKAKNLTYQEAEKLKVDFAADETNKKDTSEIEKLYRADIEIWLEGLSLTLQELQQTEVLPAKILLCGGGGLLPGLKEALEDETWSSHLPFAKKPKVNFIRPKDVINILDPNKQMRSIQDVTPMALANLALQLSGKESVMTQMLKKAIRLVER